MNSILFRRFLFLLLFMGSPFVSVRASAQEKTVAVREIDKQLFDSLKELHNQGADLFNAGDSIGSYRLFEGTLRTARAVLAHRPAEQQFIDSQLAEAGKQTTIGRRAFTLHEAIEKLRQRLRVAPDDAKIDKQPEYLKIPPREFKNAPEELLMPEKVKLPEELTIPPREFKAPKPVPPKEGVLGRLLWKGTPLPGAEVTFVAPGPVVPLVLIGKTNEVGEYVLVKVPPGRYTVLLNMPKGKFNPLPERYANSMTSPLIVDVKGGGDTLDFLLQ
ncbi:MAG: carboxypeptidase-like regulatory domain-containing protein [Planctomycetes bacterium]|nr:carboxypeptidase-like regulatory domain-containing protein [Planctomycetota bacterium]